MFVINAVYSDQIEIDSPFGEVRTFFSEIRNFVELMEGVESIRADSRGIVKWTIRADVPLVGWIKQSFPVKLTENSEDRVEWSPEPSEKENFLRYSAEFLEKSANQTLVRIEQIVELRRRSAKELHSLAGLAGETLISREMGKKVAEMIKLFLSKAKKILEN